MPYEHGHVVSIPDPHERRPSRPAVIVSDGDCPDHGKLYTVAALTGSERFGQNRYAVTVDEDEPAEGELLKQSYIEPWATQQVHRDDIRDVHAEIQRGHHEALGITIAVIVQRQLPPLPFSSHATVPFIPAALGLGCSFLLYQVIAEYRYDLPDGRVRTVPLNRAKSIGLTSVLIAVILVWGSLRGATLSGLAFTAIIVGIALLAGLSLRFAAKEAPEVAILASMIGLYYTVLY